MMDVVWEMTWKRRNYLINGAGAVIIHIRGKWSCCHASEHRRNPLQRRTRLSNKVMRGKRAGGQNTGLEDMFSGFKDLRNWAFGKVSCREGGKERSASLSKQVAIGWTPRAGGGQRGRRKDWFTHEREGSVQTGTQNRLRLEGVASHHRPEGGRMQPWAGWLPCACTSVRDSPKPEAPARSQT